MPVIHCDGTKEGGQSGPAQGHCEELQRGQFERPRNEEALGVVMGAKWSAQGGYEVGGGIWGDFVETLFDEAWSVGELDIYIFIIIYN